MRKTLRWALAALALGWLLVPSVSLPEGQLDGAFEILSAYIAINHGVLQLNAHIEYPNNQRLRTALEDGVTLAFDLQVVISRHRRMWFNATELDTTLRRELTYHAVTDRYLSRDELSADLGAQPGAELESFATLDEALQKLGRIEDLPILVQSQLHGGGPWQVSLRAGIRRGRMPAALRTLVFWSDDWNRGSDWYTWTLMP